MVRVNWTPPANSKIKDWTLLRFGYAPTSFESKPDAKGGTGLEIDKLSRAALDKHWQALPARLIEATKGTRSFRDLAIDSYETGINAWTEGFEDQFAEANGYRLRRWLPTVAGYVINSVDQTERFCGITVERQPTCSSIITLFISKSSVNNTA